MKAVICADMIGYNDPKKPQLTFEVHAGYTDPTIRDLSLPVANTIASWAKALGTLELAQIYKGTSIMGKNLAENADRDKVDPLISDILTH